MTNASPTLIAAAERLTTLWNRTARTADGGPAQVCRTSIVVGDRPGVARFGFVSLGSTIESLLGPDAAVMDVAGSGGLSIEALTRRLRDGEVASVITTAERGGPTPALPEEFVTGRSSLRSRLSELRFLLRQAGLDEVAADRGAGDVLVERIRDRWTPEAAIILDVGMLLSLGADRQRYVDDRYEQRADRPPDGDHPPAAGARCPVQPPPRHRIAEC
jgi:hypothetical protein